MIGEVSDNEDNGHDGVIINGQLKRLDDYLDEEFGDAEVIDLNNIPRNDKPSKWI